MATSTERLYNPTYQDIHNACLHIARQIKMYNHNFDYIVGLARGGLIPATILSNMTDIPLIPVAYSAKEGKGGSRNHANMLPDISGKMILIIDDIIDSGLTMLEVADHYVDNGNNIVHTGTIYFKALAKPVIVPNFYWVVIPEDAPWVIYEWEKDEVR